MAGKCENGVFQQENGVWGYRFSILIDGRRISRKKLTDENGKPLKTQRINIVQIAYGDYYKSFLR